MKWKWLLFILFTGNYAAAQKGLQFSIGGQLGFSYLRTAYDDLVWIGSELPMERESILSTPKLAYGLSGNLDYEMSDIFVLNSGVSILQNGYQYKINNYLGQSYTKAIYNRLELDVGLGLKSYIFSTERVFPTVKKRYRKKGKRRKKLDQLKKRQKRKSTIRTYLLSNYNLSLMLNENYNYANIDDLSDLTTERRTFLHGYTLGFGLEKNKVDWLFYYHSDISDFIKNDEVNDYYLKNVGLKVSYKL